MNNKSSAGKILHAAPVIAVALAFVLSLFACSQKDEASIPDSSSKTDDTCVTTTVSETEPQIITSKNEETTVPEETVYQNAVKDYLLPLDSFSWEREYKPEMVMIHFTSAVVLYRDDPYNIEYIRDIFIDYEVSVHYIIERDGTIRCYIPEERVAWHAGKGEFGGNEKYTNAMNHYSIGIELVGMGSQNDMSGYMSASEYKALDDSLKGFTDAQYEALKPLLEDICARYGIPIDRDHIIGHEEYSQKKKDPGELFEWERIIPQI